MGASIVLNIIDLRRTSTTDIQRRPKRGPRADGARAPEAPPWACFVDRDARPGPTRGGAVAQRQGAAGSPKCQQGGSCKILGDAVVTLCLPRRVASQGLGEGPVPLLVAASPLDVPGDSSLGDALPSSALNG